MQIPFRIALASSMLVLGLSVVFSNHASAQMDASESESSDGQMMAETSMAETEMSTTQTTEAAMEPMTSADTPCLPAGESSTTMTDTWVPLAHGETKIFLCSASAGTSYRFDVVYDAADTVPGDGGNYIAIESYRLNHVGVAWGNRSSEPNGDDRETVARSADTNEVWQIQVTNTASSPAYDTSFWLSSHRLSGSD